MNVILIAIGLVFAGSWWATRSSIYGVISLGVFVLLAFQQMLPSIFPPPHGLIFIGPREVDLKRPPDPPMLRKAPRPAPADPRARPQHIPLTPPFPKPPGTEDGIHS